VKNLISDLSAFPPSPVGRDDILFRRVARCPLGAKRRNSLEPLRLTLYARADVRKNVRASPMLLISVLLRASNTNAPSVMVRNASLTWKPRAIPCARRHSLHHPTRRRKSACRRLRRQSRDRNAAPPGAACVARQAAHGSRWPLVSFRHTIEQLCGNSFDYRFLRSLDAYVSVIDEMGAELEHRRMAN
jgi:hypothetical protein